MLPAKTCQPLLYFSDGRKIERWTYQQERALVAPSKRKASNLCQHEEKARGGHCLSYQMRCVDLYVGGIYGSPMRNVLSAQIPSARLVPCVRGVDQSQRHVGVQVVL